MSGTSENTGLTGARRGMVMRSLQGLAVGDALGGMYFGANEQVLPRIAGRLLPASEFWPYSDDTVMALSIVDSLASHGKIQQDFLAMKFGQRYRSDPVRGYGAAAHQILGDISVNIHWEIAARSVFGGQGSKGNGAAMRVGPLGAFFHDDLNRAAQQAAASAVVTHAHPEAAAGAIAIAVAAGWVAAGGSSAEGLFRSVLDHTPPGATSRRIHLASTLGKDLPTSEAAMLLGSGQEVLAEDTVPFSLWCAAHHLDSYAGALWSAIEGLGDRDTTSAMVGSIVGLRSAIPAEWVAFTEPLPDGYTEESIRHVGSSL